MRSTFIHRRFLASAALFVALAGACGEASQDTNFPAEPLFVVTSDAGLVHVTVRTKPHQPPARGMNQVQYIIADANDVALEGLTLDVTPWMPAMGHGASVAPDVIAEDAGTYLIKDVSLYMPGDWQLRTTIQGSVNDSVAPTLIIR